MNQYGFSDEQWGTAKQEVTTLLAARAKLRGMIPYSELVASLKTVRLEAHDQRLFNLLGDVSTDEDNASRGLLSVIVVHKRGDMQPGPGFFELAKQRGRDTSDILACWVNELKKVHAFWSSRK